MIEPPKSSAEIESLYRLLIESVRDYAIFVLDVTGHIMTWNAGAQRLKGYAADDIIGQHFSVFYPESDIAAGKPAQELIDAARLGRFEDEGWRIRKDGTRFWANVIITALRDPTGRLVGFAKVTRDLTERRAAQEREIATARRIAEAEAANRAKSEFLATMSHELRTPLNAIGGFTEILLLGLRGPITAEQERDLQRIQRSQQHLLSIINDLLHFSQIAAGKIEYHMAPVAISTVVDAVSNMMAPQMATKGLAFAVEGCTPDLIACADGVKVEQIILNLLSNATKFTPAGGHVALRCSQNDTNMMITISDTGPGIATEYQEAIFDPFVQVGRSFSTIQEGVGLGLAISRDLARAMRGDLTVKSTAGAGAAFTLVLARDTPAAAAH